ncbi:MAG TPA: peptidoglycan-binding domain-containing protein, partial [Vulgatibacter sp.]|nr:peptidoglycan-binding domain-containing protein [Vulgatibacter sp.]
MRSATAIALLLLFGCASQPRLPDGVRVVPLEAPPPTADEVREAQERLTALGVYDGQVNGELGARTRVALARFQRIAGLTPTGRLDAPTMEALERASTAPR